MRGWDWVAFVILVGCGARTGIAAGAPDFLDASIADVSVVDAGHPLDAAKDVAVEPPVGVLCCDDGLKVAGCQTCAGGETCIDKGGTV